MTTRKSMETASRLIDRIENEIRRIHERYPNRDVRATWTISGMPTGGLKWGTKEYVRVYLEDRIAGKECALSDGSRTLWASREYIRHYKSGLRKDDLDEREADEAYADYVCTYANHAINRKVS